MANVRTRGNDVGPTGKTVGENVERIRRGRRMALKELSAELSALGRPISLSGLSKLENGDRKADSDDLMALALALNVSPVALLLPQGNPSDLVEVTGGRGAVGLLWEWAYAQEELVAEDRRSFQARSLPAWFHPLAQIRAQGDSSDDEVLELSFSRTQADG